MPVSEERQQQITKSLKRCSEATVAAALRFVNDAHPGLLPMAQLPALAAHSVRMEALPVFKAVSQAFIPPSS